jgi:hypothetical protein
MSQLQDLFKYAQLSTISYASLQNFDLAEEVNRPLLIEAGLTDRQIERLSTVDPKTYKGSESTSFLNQSAMLSA